MQKHGVFLLSLMLMLACNPSAQEQEIERERSLIQLEQGFEFTHIAAEPMIEAPVALDFDENGRPWVVEMRGYMPNVMGQGEEEPNGRITLLKDLDGDGIMEKAHVFLDSLVLPRAIHLMEGGLLYASPPNLWWVEISSDDRPGKKVLVDSSYVLGGNVEHQPNGLIYGRDNWIYSAKSTARYRLKEGIWEKDETKFRGQWGISQDDFGHLFYNDNSTLLRGDHFGPNDNVQNPHFDARISSGQAIVTDQRVYPLHATAVNRGYKPEVLDERGVLQNTTSACGPLIYRGHQFPQAYRGNAFVAAPEANLIKRILLTRKANRIEGAQAYTDKEFLASTLESFRPVNLYTGPDGCLWGVDMHRGIIQHATYLTDYLKDLLADRGLDTVHGKGRIFRISHKENSVEEFPRLGELNDDELLPMLGHENGWVRDKAQELLVQRNAYPQIAKLRAILGDSNQKKAWIHGAWTLAGMGDLRGVDLDTMIKDANPQYRATAARLLGEISLNVKGELNDERFARLMADTSRWVQGHLVIALGKWRGQVGEKALENMQQIARKYPHDPLIHEALLSSLAGDEQAFLNAWGENTPINLVQMLRQSIRHIEKPGPGETFKAERNALFTMGHSLYILHCSSCHHKDGIGIQGLAPPLKSSEWVRESDKNLLRILLQGMEGPIMVDGQLYKAPDIAPMMPGLKENTILNDAKIAAIATFIRNVWGNRASFVQKETVMEIRKELKGKTRPFTSSELKKIRD